MSKINCFNMYKSKQMKTCGNMRYILMLVVLIYNCQYCLASAATPEGVYQNVDPHVCHALIGCHNDPHSYRTCVCSGISPPAPSPPAPSPPAPSPPGFIIFE